MTAEKNNDESLQDLIQVVRGAPSSDELAAVIAVLDALHAEELATAKGFERPLKSSWSRNASQMRADIVPGSGQWRGAYRSGLN